MKGKITISRWHSNQGGDGISIKVRDETSGIEFLEVELTLQDFALAVTGLAQIECDFELRAAHNVGKVREHKTVIVETQHPIRTDADKAAVLLPYEVDGWKGYKGDLGNHHKQAGNGYHVSFSRYVDAE